MEVYVIYVTGGDACIRHAHGYGARRLLAAFLQANAVEGLTSRAVTGDFGQGSSPSGARMLIVFEEEHPAPLGRNEAIAICRKRARGPLRRMVPRGRHDAHQGEAFHDAWRDRRVDAPGQHHRNEAELNLPEGISQRVGRRGTPCRDHMAHAAKAEAALGIDRGVNSVRSAFRSSTLSLRHVLDEN